MRGNRRRLATTGLVVLALVLGSLWAAGPTAPAAGGPAGGLSGRATLPGIGPAVLPDPAQALRPAAARPGPGGRLLPLLLGLAVAAVAAAFRPRPGRGRSGAARPRSPLPSAPRGARAPPHLQPA
jgi:hypothetical protein